MPELPEVETMCRGIQGIVGSRINDLAVPSSKYKRIRIHPTVRTIKRRVRGRTIRAIDRVAKRVLVRLDSADTLVFEPRMTGLVLLSDPPNRIHLRVGLFLDSDENPELWFWDRRGLGSVKLFTEQELAVELSSDRIGPDALIIESEELRERLKKSDRMIKVALLDQKAVAGIGNLYASELLFVAGIHPEKKCRLLSGAQWNTIIGATRTVLNQAIKHEGSTLSDGTYRNALNQSGSYQNHHRVYDREGLPCFRCGSTILRRVHAQRSTFFCKICQRKK